MNNSSSFGMTKNWNMDLDIANVTLIASLVCQRTRERGDRKTEDE